MVRAKPVTLTQSDTNPQPGYDPEPLVVVGELPAAAITPAAAVANIATADGSDAATTQALANATKAKVNDLLAKLRTAGLLTP